MQNTLHSIIIGAGQAGLAAAYYLKRAGADFVVLEANKRVGDNWRKRWDGLELFTPQRYNGLPGLPPNGADWELIDRLQAANYLERYVETFELPVLLHRTCVSARKTEVWEVSTKDEVFRAHHLVVATGAYKDAHIPQPVRSTFPESTAHYHSSDVSRVAKIVDGATSLLVVGAGASGQQLARLGADAGAKVVLAGPNVANLPRTLLGRDVYWWLYSSGVMTLRTDNKLGDRLLGKPKGIVTVGEAKPLPGVRRVPFHVHRFADHTLYFRNKRGKIVEEIPWPEGHGVVIWCTGYRNRYPFLPDWLLGSDGQPDHRGGVSTKDPTVVFLGLENLRRASSSLLGGVGRDAAEIVPTLFE